MADYGHGDLSWFKEARFGMFIHWGLYSMPARHEWIQHQEKITKENYQKYFDLYNPDLFNPKEWARAAREAGMRYFVITAKHHEGFCNWDTKYTDYKITNTQFGRDALREVVDAFRAEGIHVGFYYSLIDWHHPDFVLDHGPNSKGPYRDLPEEELKKMNEGRDMHRYAEYMRNQVTELLTNYGKIDIIWFDFSYPPKDANGNRIHDTLLGKDRDDWESEKLIKLVRSLQPDIIVDNRLDLPGAADIVTPEQYTPDTEMKDEFGNPVAWEGCQTFSGSWGYFRDETSWKSTKQCIDMLINHVSRNGNLLMNVGPTSRGYIDQRAMDRLAGYAKWMKYNSRSIYGCGAAPSEFPAPEDARYTYNPKTKRLYLHLINWPFNHITLKGLGHKVKYAQLLHDGSEIKFSEEQKQDLNAYTAMSTACGAISLHLPVLKPDVEVPVIELILK